MGTANWIEAKNKQTNKQTEKPPPQQNQTLPDFTIRFFWLTISEHHESLWNLILYYVKQIHFVTKLTNKHGLHNSNVCHLHY